MARDRRPFRTVPRPPAPGEPWGPTTRRRPGAIRGAARLTGRAVTGYGRWVAHSPETRGLGTALAALYPAGEDRPPGPRRPDPDRARSPRPPRWPPGPAPARPTAPAATPPPRPPRRPGCPPGWPPPRPPASPTCPCCSATSAAAAAGWSAVTWSDVLAHRRALQAARARWDTIATAAGLEDCRLVRQEETRTGQRFTVDIRHTRKTARQLARRRPRPSGSPPSWPCPPSGSRVATDPKHAGQHHHHRPDHRPVGRPRHPPRPRPRARSRPAGRSWPARWCSGPTPTPATAWT